MTGLIQHFHHADSDGGNATANLIVTGGRHAIPSEVREQRGIGSHKAFQYVPGLLTPNGSVDFRVQDKDLLVRGIRVAGVLPEFQLGCGDTAWDATHKNCKCNSLALHGAAGEELTASFGWMAKTATEQALGGAQTATSDVVLMWHVFSISGLAGLILTSFDIVLTHRLVPQPVLETPSADVKRFPKYLVDTGQDAISLTFTALAQGGADITADALAAIATIAITFTGSKTVVLTCTGCWLSEKNEDFTPDAMATKGLIYNCDDLTIT